MPLTDRIAGLTARVEYYAILFRAPPDQRRQVLHLRDAFNLPIGAAWLLQRLDQAAPDYVAPSPFTADVDHLARIREALGGDAVHTDVHKGASLTPLGRFRVRNALGRVWAA